jgi:protocatechuate 3,4-dioxygenase alpha subunit
MTKPVTASQTIGPFWHLLADPTLADLTRAGATEAGSKLVLTGQVRDGDGVAVRDACVEIWQVTPERSRVFPGWGRCATNEEGIFQFVTMAPDPAAPYLSVAIFSRGLVKPLWTRVYFADIADPLLASLTLAQRGSLLATPDGEVWRWDIRLQGADSGSDRETVFLEM